ncbi:DUF1684 domain-containing protein [Streptomyces sp. NPDC010273]|uniref:DUF1684 domain-containing protein n=1 Tax=Streptomyces sp. NPDC010273 TaxID=3364829 RepID=UPI0036E05752
MAGLNPGRPEDYPDGRLPDIPGGRILDGDTLVLTAPEGERTGPAGWVPRVNSSSSATRPTPRGRTTVDFNRAVLPPCAFAEHFICPFPPPGNTLGVAIEAGERTLRQARR